jgi:hypothetical protein
MAYLSQGTLVELAMEKCGQCGTAVNPGYATCPACRARKVENYVNPGKRGAWLLLCGIVLWIGGTVYFEDNGNSLGVLLILAAIVGVPVGLRRINSRGTTQWIKERLIVGQ